MALLGIRIVSITLPALSVSTHWAASVAQVSARPVPPHSASVHETPKTQPAGHKASMPSKDSPIQPLSETRIVDLSQNLAGPYAVQILADLGADVIKVEPPEGDAARDWGPPFIGGQSPLFQAANRNKRSVCLDLKDPSDREVLYGLTAEW